MAASLTAAIALASLLAAPSGPTPSGPTPSVDPSTSPPAPTSSLAPPAASLAPQRDHLPRPPSPRLTARRLDRKGLRGARTMVAAGGAVFALFYLGGTFAGAAGLDEIAEDGQLDPDERDPRRAARLMFVPVIGPLVAAPLGETRGDKAALAAHGILQGLAAATLVAGGIALARDRRARRLEVSAGPIAGGGSLSLRGRF